MHLLPRLQAPDSGVAPPTLLCFVLVAPGSDHAFCSAYDFGPWPLLKGVRSWPQNVQQVGRGTRTVLRARGR